MTAGILVLFAGYTIGSYGIVLLRGWDIPWRQWVNPLDPWQWPAKGTAMPPIPAGQIFPGKGSAPAPAAAGAGPVPGPGGNPASNPDGTVAGGHGR